MTLAYRPTDQRSGAMNRRAFLTTVCASIVAAPLVAEAQQSGTVYRIGGLAPDLPPPGLLETFAETLRGLGYVEGKNIVIESRHAEGNHERLAGLADELLQLKPDLILTVNTPAAQAAKKATAAIPIVMTRVADPVRSGLVSSISRPGGNITGLSFMPETLSAKQLQLLREAVPGVSTVAAVWYASNPGAATVVKEMASVSGQLGLRLVNVPVRRPSDFRSTFDTAIRGGAGAVVVVDDAFMTQHRIEIIDLAMKHMLPVFSLYKPFAEAGGLIAYGASTSDMYRRAALYADKILKGAKPGDLPIQQPTKFELVINLRTARALGLTIPQSLIVRADEVIQ